MKIKLRIPTSQLWTLLCLSFLLIGATTALAQQARPYPFAELDEDQWNEGYAYGEMTDMAAGVAAQGRTKAAAAIQQAADTWNQFHQAKDEACAELGEPGDPCNHQADDPTMPMLHIHGDFTAAP